MSTGDFLSFISCALLSDLFWFIDFSFGASKDERLVVLLSVGYGAEDTGFNFTNGTASLVLGSCFWLADGLLSVITGCNASAFSGVTLASSTTADFLLSFGSDFYKAHAVELQQIDNKIHMYVDHNLSW